MTGRTSLHSDHSRRQSETSSTTVVELENMLTIIRCCFSLFAVHVVVGGYCFDVVAVAAAAAAAVFLGGLSWPFPCCCQSQ